MNTKTLIYLFLSTVKIVMAKSKEPATSIKINVLESCREYKNASIMVYDLLLNNIGVNQLEISGRTIVKEVVDSPIQMLVDIGTCTNKDNSEKCRHNFHPVIDDYCEALKDTESHPSKFLQLWGLNSSCPILPANYTFTPKDFTTEYLQPIAATLGNFWTVRIILADQENNVKFCIYGECEASNSEVKRDFKFKKIPKN